MITAAETERYLAPTEFLDWESPAVADFTTGAVGTATDPREKAVNLFVAVRDGFRYDPYSVSSTREDFKASAIVATTGTWCVPKALLLTAASRGAGIPARIGFADVQNHLQSERLRERMGTDLFVYHGYTELLLEERWVKATPAFNIELCERLGVAVLEFDGVSDALLQPFSQDGSRHMEYLRDRGTRDDFPYEEVMGGLAAHYGFTSTVTPLADDAIADETFRPTPT